MFISIITFIIIFTAIDIKLRLGIITNINNLLQDNFFKFTHAVAFLFLVYITKSVLLFPETYPYLNNRIELFSYYIYYLPTYFFIIFMFSWIFNLLSRPIIYAIDTIFKLLLKFLETESINTSSAFPSKKYKSKNIMLTMHAISLTKKLMNFSNQILIKKQLKVFDRIKLSAGQPVFTLSIMVILISLAITLLGGTFSFLSDPYTMNEYINEYDGTLMFLCNDPNIENPCSHENFYSEKIIKLYTFNFITIIIIYPFIIYSLKDNGNNLINSIKKSKNLLDLITKKISYFLFFYFLIGLFFSGAHSFIYSFDNSVIKIPENSEFDILTAIYFSFVTLSTLGYGEITPVSDSAKLLTILESTIGVLYLSIVVGASVGYGISSFTHKSDILTKSKKRFTIKKRIDRNKK